MRRKTFIVGLTALLCCVAMTQVRAQGPREEFKENIFKSGSNYYAYPGPQQQKLTPAPKGYVPYYISHYGRHGSRYLIGENDYDRAWKVLSRADSLGKLTSYGQDVLRRVTLLRNEADKRLGELTLLGAEQHRGIAHRMYERFPEVFKGVTDIDAKSTVVIRCILSMENALQELKSLNPKLRIRHDASEHDMWYMNNWDKKLKDKQWNDETRKAYNAFKKRHQNYDRVMQVLFNDTAYVNHEVNAESLNYHLFKLASNIQSSEIRHTVSLYDLFTADEVYDNWMIENAGWYIGYGPCPLNGALQPFSQRQLLGKIIEEADANLGKKHPGATLRYGHEVCVMPLACLLEMDNCVIATGGGTPCHPGAMEAINANAKSIYLQLSEKELVERLMTSKKKRPLTHLLSEPELRDYVRKNLPVREPWYLQAHLTCPTPCSVEELVRILK